MRSSIFKTSQIKHTLAIVPNVGEYGKTIGNITMTLTSHTPEDFVGEKIFVTTLGNNPQSILTTEDIRVIRRLTPTIVTEIISELNALHHSHEYVKYFDVDKYEKELRVALKLFASTLAPYVEMLRESDDSLLINIIVVTKMCRIK